jgi:NTE family protein
MAGLGVLAALDEAGLQPDLLAGCSAGALFAALVASGRRPLAAAELACSLWSPELARQRRWLGLVQLICPRLGFGPGFSLRSDHLIMERLREVFGNQRLDTLTTPLRVATTDPATGCGVLLDSGDLVDALRASMAMPFLFTPGCCDGRRLVDGFLSDPLPVRAVPEARVVLAVQIDAPLPHRLDAPGRLLGAMTASLLNNLVEARLAAMAGQGQAVLSVRPALPRRVGLFDTAALPEVLQAGLAAGRAALPALRALLAQPALRAAA